MSRPALVLALALAAAPARAEDARDAYVASNLLAVLYHELGHALIDTGDLPVFGQEEDAADTLSILMIDTLFDDDTARTIAYDTADGFAADARLAADDIAWWDTHGPDAQRYYNLVCLFYGADPDTRDDFAADMGLPDDRADTCPEEYDLAIDSWGPVLDELMAQGGTAGLIYTGTGTSLTHRTIKDEVRALNAVMTMPAPLRVSVAPCGEPNAFYDPQDISITICTEFEDYLRKNSP
ncbi:DUF4344 domain-containing metallopeptidase [Sulfitobacter sp. S190]|uniref:DUF4344 domain-containing metallopeptidase n=1 Tax=Sulfitobacter sp. S190 TaxID=2867022 RepID=UPI0021A5FF54|nr:DUF4344 domain-containing metallopeptidase [Sulfitobacter sp. S190]UWR21694.1 DUF4344 domain-containing metallopeptidase [Sulfitobacter sp. S190]